MCMPDEDYSMDAHILSLKTENEWYMIDPDILPEIQLESQLRVRTLYVCVTMTVNFAPFVTCIPQHDEMGKINPWHESGHRTMEEASELILKGFRLKTDTEFVKWPDRYFDERGAGMWSKIMKLLR